MKPVLNPHKSVANKALIARRDRFSESLPVEQINGHGLVHLLARITKKGQPRE